MKRIKYNKLLWILMVTGVAIGGVLIFSFQQTGPLEPEEKNSSFVSEKVERSEISQESEAHAIVEEIKGSLDLFKHLRTENGKIRPAPSSAVTVVDPTTSSGDYISDKNAAELGLSRHQVAEFQRIVDYYRLRWDQHITDNSTVEVLGDGHHKIKVPKMEGSSDIRNAAHQEIQLVLGSDKYDEFSNLDKGNFDKFLKHFGEYPRTLEIQATGEKGPFGGEMIQLKDTIHYKAGISVWSRGNYSSKLNYKEFNFYTDLIASYN